MLKEGQSLEKFTRLITEQYGTHCANYGCLERFHGVLKVCKLFLLLFLIKIFFKYIMCMLHLQESYNSRVSFFHLLHQEDQGSQLGILYQRVQQTVMAIAEGKVKPSKLIKLAKEK